MKKQIKRNTVKKKTPPPAMPVTRHMIYPQYYRKDSTYIQLHSEKDYTQVQLLKTCTVITRGNNIHVIDSLKDATVIDSDRYRMALGEAELRIKQ